MALRKKRWPKGYVSQLSEENYSYMVIKNCREMNVFPILKAAVDYISKNTKKKRKFLSSRRKVLQVMYLKAKMNSSNIAKVRSFIVKKKIFGVE